MHTDAQPEQPPTEPLAATPGTTWRAPENGTCGYLIRIPEKKDRERAISAFRRVRAAHVRFPGHVMGVTEEHLRALVSAQIPFENLSKPAHGEEEDTTVQS